MIPIILCGGVGQRLWPVSRAATPKPFMRVAGKSLLQRTVARASAIPGVSQCAVVTNASYPCAWQTTTVGPADVVHVCH